MSLQSDVAGVLRNEPVGRISFKVENIVVDKAKMESVAKAIESQDIAIEVGGTGVQLGAAYSSFTGRRVLPGERKLIGKITLGSAHVAKTALGKAAIFHESVHAIMDVQAHKLSMHNDEVVAYLADALYLRATKTAISGGAMEKAIFDAAFAIVDGRRMLARKGASLTWRDCDALRKAIQAHPAYHG